MPILYPSSNRFKYARSASDFRARRYAIQNPYSPSVLFAAMEQGAWYDISDLSTLFQDVAGTIPAVVGLSVARINDKSGNGNHATQVSPTSRAILMSSNGKYWLQADGIDDWYITPTITPGTDKAQVFAGVRKLSDAAAGILLETSQTVNSNNGALWVAAPESTGSLGNYATASRGDGSVIPAQLAKSAVKLAPTTDVITCTHDIAADLSTIRRNGVAGANGTGEKGTGNFLAYPLYLFRRGGTAVPFNGHFYGGIIRFGPNLPIETIQQTEAWMAAKTGVTL